MNIIVTSLFVNNQDKALQFYTDVLGFVKREDVPIGEFRWITVVSPNNPNGTELILEPNNNPIAQEYQQKLVASGIPATMFGVEDIEQEYKRLVDKGVTFTMKPTQAGPVIIAVFEDTCGNLIQITQR
ncbi:VOC family protein [Lysinibacillus piscis]|uniref:VOC domain-containing protein n=1 Tax=Lysinibacillus piscis TaxID=2518931 RepID=A0ABQ5NLA8_9BACI|nr:VOC family protein [Lysinibacillus sp. KH24]GLC89084.1 hypothetical protein LYSBPC_22110 [Lysinibacillus sp. KH24]